MAGTRRAHAVRAAGRSAPRLLAGSVAEPRGSAFSRKRSGSKGDASNGGGSLNTTAATSSAVPAPLITPSLPWTGRDDEALAEPSDHGGARRASSAAAPTTTTARAPRRARARARSRPEAPGRRSAASGGSGVSQICRVDADHDRAAVAMGMQEGPDLARGVRRRRRRRRPWAREEGRRRAGPRAAPRPRRGV